MPTPTTLDVRSAGVLLHLSSLPGPGGLGDLGSEAHRFAACLGRAGQSWWQFLPISPAGSADSPYQSASAFAGDPLYISLESLITLGWLKATDLPKGSVGHPADRALAQAQRWPLLQKAFQAFQSTGTPGQRERFTAFCESQRSWLDDYALFEALKAHHGGLPWTRWEPGLRDRHQAALEKARPALVGLVDLHRFLQWCFHAQWMNLRKAAADKGVGLIGDLPIFVSHDSAEVWAHRELFELGPDGEPTAVAGVPPDYFSEEGQHWGNPLYRWPNHEATGYQWWVDRFWRLFQLFDAVRVDHFIGFHRYWSIPASASSAKEGAYLPGPGAPFFEALAAALGPLPLIAEDLGVGTPEVAALRARFGFPGMRILQFSFGDDETQRPELFAEDSVAYTGTHDNNTTRGWLDDAAAKIPGEAARERERALACARALNAEPVWGLVETCFATRSRLAILPAQDLLGLGGEFRMNTPGTVDGNWAFRLEPGALTPEHEERLKAMTQKTGRSTHA